MTVGVGVIEGEEAEKFRDRLLNAIRSNRSFSTPEKLTGFVPYASILIEGVYTPTYDERSYEEQVGDETKEYVEKTWTARFEYQVVDKETGGLVVDGIVEARDSKTEEEGSGGILGIIVDLIGILVSADPFSSLQADLANRFIGEISPHEMRVTVTLFEDSDIPELKTGIASARTGQWKTALATFLDAVGKHAGHKNIHKAYYNAGVAYEYDHQYSLAWEFLEKAYQISSEPEYRGEIYRCRRYEQEWKWREGYLEKLRMMGREVRREK
jgi:tetratricopeptide (TPR) repeat protein